MEFDKDFAYGLDNEIEMTHLEKLKQDFIKKTATAIFDIFTDRNKKDTVVEALEKNLNELIKEACIDFKIDTRGLKNAIEPYRSYIVEAIEAEYDDYFKQQKK